MSESYLIEYKESWLNEYLKWIYSFANTNGHVIGWQLTPKSQVSGKVVGFLKKLESAKINQENGKVYPSAAGRLNNSFWAYKRKS